MDTRSVIVLSLFLILLTVLCFFLISSLLHGKPFALFDWSRLYFAAGILAFVGFIFVVAMAFYAFGPEGTRGKEIFDACVKALPPIVTLVIGFYFGAHQDTPRSSGSLSSASVITRCVVVGFPDGMSRLSATKSTVELGQQPPGCVETLISRIKEAQPLFMLIVGRVDRRELISRTRETYGSNFALAYQRALTVQADLLRSYEFGPRGSEEHLSKDELASRMVMLAGGPSYIDRELSESNLAADRCVEILGFWHH